MKREDITVFVAVLFLIVLFSFGVYAGNNQALREEAYNNRIEKCLIKNKELPQPREYCRAAVNQGVE